MTKARKEKTMAVAAEIKTLQNQIRSLRNAEQRALKAIPEDKRETREYGLSKHNVLNYNVAIHQLEDALTEILNIVLIN